MGEFLKVSFKTTIGDIAKAAGGNLIYGNPDSVVKTITTDSRDIGEDNLFIPIIGERFDGHSFVEPMAKSRSISGFLTMRESDRIIAEEYGASAVLCRDTLHAFGRIACCHRKDLNPIVIGITGTNGKTTTKEIISSVLSHEYKCLKNEKNYNNEIGVPFTLLGLKRHHEFAVVEMGMNHAGEIDRLSKIALPDVALITNIGEGHLEFLGDVENVALEKSEIMNGMDSGAVVFLNMDTKGFDILLKKAGDKGLNVKTFGLSEGADICPDSYKLNMDSVEIRHMGETFIVPVYGIHNVYNVISAIAIGMHFGIGIKDIKDALLNFNNIDMRSRIIKGDCIIIDDTYNSNPLSSRYALMSASEVFPEMRKIAVLSDMKELGASSEFYHLELGREVYKYNFDLLFAWGEMAEDIAAGAKGAGMNGDSIFYFNEKNDLIGALEKNIKNDDVVLVKGSRSMKMEEVVDRIVR